jgi:hypothetical protein
VRSIARDSERWKAVGESSASTGRRGSNRSEKKVKIMRTASGNKLVCNGVETNLSRIPDVCTR